MREVGLERWGKRLCVKEGGRSGGQSSDSDLDPAK